MGKSFFKRSNRGSIGTSALFTSAVQPKFAANNIDENPASPTTQDDLKKVPTAATVESSKEQLSKQEQVTQPKDGKTEQAAPKQGEGELNTETMIQVLRNKLGLQDVCNEDAELTSLSDEMGTSDEEEVSDRPQVVHQHEKIVLEDLNGSLAFLTFSRFAVVEEATHLLIKVRVGLLDTLMHI